MQVIRERVQRLRDWMQENGYSAIIVPTNDPHFSEYVSDYWKSREYISGFTGSAGTVVITQKAAMLWCDSRYFIQAENELDMTLYKIQKIGMPETPTINDWLKENLWTNSVVVTDGKLTSVKAFSNLSTDLSPIQVEAINDPFINLWDSRPEMPKSMVRILDDSVTGESVSSKLERVREALSLGADDLYITSTLDEISWLLNIRGADVSFCPVVVAYLLIHSDKVTLFIDNNKLLASDLEVLNNKGVAIEPYSDFNSYLATINETKIIYNPGKLDIYHYNILIEGKNRLVSESSIYGIITEFKAIKNSVEIRGMQRAMISDGVSLIKFNMWLERALDNGEYIDEMIVSDKLQESRMNCPTFVGNSFSSIVGYRENGAIVHYSPTKENSKPITSDGFILIDSGGQYEYGTTDITRTIHLSTPTEQEKSDFTLVLKGNISLSTAVFTVGTRGCQLDILARQHLLKQGLNYMHGTGHGIGHYLNVHEGPQSILKDCNSIDIKAGMLLSNEPGLYRKGEYGIRIENVIKCVEHSTTEFGSFLKFETITLFPIDVRAISVGMLTSEERHWLNRYHSMVYDKLAQFLDTEERLWLANKTKAI